MIFIEIGAAAQKTGVQREALIIYTALIHSNLV